MISEHVSLAVAALQQAGEPARKRIRAHAMAKVSVRKKRQGPGSGLIVVTPPHGLHRICRPLPHAGDAIIRQHSQGYPPIAITGVQAMDCPTCGAPASPDGPDMVVNSSDGPLLLTRWRCAANHWWHMTTDASPVSATEAGCGPADWLANEIALAIAFSRISGPGAGKGDPHPR